MNIIFVGLHNKPGCMPLDSKTQSGKRIDAVIENMKGINCLKVNLFDVDYMPLGEERQGLIIDFFDRVGICTDDIVVCLGGSVQKYLSNELACTVVNVPHPSPLHAKYNLQQYIELVTNKINSALKPEA